MGSYIAKKMVLIVKSDSNDLENGKCFGINCGSPGPANIIDAEGNTRTNYPMQQGYNPISVKRVLTGGTADDMWALY